MIDPAPTLDAPARRRSVGALAADERILVVLGLAMIAVALAPWTTSGTVARNGFATAGSGLRLEVVQGPARVLTVVWLFVPPLVGLVTLLVLVHRRRLAALLAVPVGVVGVLAGVAVRSGPLDPTAAPLLEALLGCAITGWGSLMLVRMRAGGER